MRATDDATIASSRRPLVTLLLTVALAAVLGAALGTGLAWFAAPTDQPLFEARLPWTGGAPLAGEWPHAPRPGESARLASGANGLVLIVRAPSAAATRALAAALASARAAGVVALADARAAANAELLGAAALAPTLAPATGPAPAPSPTIECAATLLAAAARARVLVEHLPAPYASEPEALSPVPPAALAAALGRLERAAESGELADVRAALAESAREEAAWFAEGLPARTASAGSRGDCWRAWQLERASALEALAATAVAGEPANALALARALAPAQAPALAALLPPAYAGLVLGGAPVLEPAVTPLPEAWARVLGWGALLGALCAAAAAALGMTRLRGFRPAGGTAFLPDRDPAARLPWLHVVAGPDAGSVARATLELAAHALAAGERVLVVDAGPRLKLHARFGREARWGLIECLVAEMPVLGLVQYGGRPGFYLLAHGNPARGEGWASLGRRLDDARPHFGRIILALDSQAPRAIGDALAGRALEGWWAAPVTRLPRAAVELTARLGIAFSGLNLAAIPEVQLELLSARVKALGGERPLAAPSATPAPEPVARVVVAPEPVVLDCDLQVRQRLRFLAWMRRVQAERRPSAGELPWSEPQAAAQQ